MTGLYFSTILKTYTRQEDLDTLYAALQEHHPDLYANTPQEAFEAKKAEIEGRLAEESDVDFALDLQSLVALIGDSHTTTNIGSVLNSTGLYPFGAEWYDGSWVLTGAEEEDAALLGQTVTALNGVPMDEICTRFGTLVSADNPVKLRRQTEQLLYSEACLDYLGIAESGEPLEVTTSGGSFTVEALPMEGFGDAALSSSGRARLPPPTGRAPTTLPSPWMTPPITFNLTSAWRTPSSPWTALPPRWRPSWRRETTARCCWISATTAAAPTACWSPSLCWCPAWWRRA